VKPFLLFVASNTNSFLPYCLKIGRIAIDRGYKIGIVAPKDSQLLKATKLGFEVFFLPSWQSYYVRLTDLSALYRLYQDLRPTIVHHLGFKPVIYGSLIARLTKIPWIVNSISSLESLMNSHHFGADIKIKIIQILFKVSLCPSNAFTIFQNSEDKNFFCNRGIIPESKTAVISGSGIDIRKYIPSVEPAMPPRIFFAGSLFSKNGVKEFTEAIQSIRREGIKARFIVSRDMIDTNLGEDSRMVPREIINEWINTGVIECFERSIETVAILRQVHIVVLPTFYEDIVSTSLLEAAAAGRPIIATNTANCRVIIKDGYNGFLVPVKDSTALVQAIKCLILNSLLRVKMGLAGRNHVINAGLSEEIVVQKTFAVYEALLGVASTTEEDIVQSVY
jgi:glycosyltransferase involved in cell wall biosynthesis